MIGDALRLRGNGGATWVVACGLDNQRVRSHGTPQVFQTDLVSSE